MATLADSFLEDLEELEGEEDAIAPPPASGPMRGTETQHVELGSDLDELDDGEEGLAGEAARDVATGGAAGHAASGGVSQADALLSRIKPTDVNDVAKLQRSTRFKEHMRRVAEALKLETSGAVSREGSVEYDPLYQLVVDSNQLMVEIREEIAALHKYVAGVYATKFPELEGLVPNPLEYVKVVQRIGNEMDMTVVDLSDLLPTTQVMVVTIAGSTTSGKALDEAQLGQAMRGCDAVQGLQAASSQIVEFVERHMSSIAPNTSALVGPRVAALLIGQAGGLAALSKIPACNVQVLGRERKALGGFSTSAIVPHAGILYGCDLVQSAPPDLRMRACRALSGKVTLCARVDAHGGEEAMVGGELGERFRREIEAKIEKWQEPPPGKTKKPLKAPDDMPKRKRGGKRMRKQKERLELTEMRKQANRVAFAKATGEYADDAMGRGLGMLEQEGGVGSALRVTKKEQRVAKRQRRAITAGSSGATSGLASSLAFTPVQGMELANPEAAAARVKAANEKYFSSSSGFYSVVKQ